MKRILIGLAMLCSLSSSVHITAQYYEYNLNQDAASESPYSGTERVTIANYSMTYLAVAYVRTAVRTSHSKLYDKTAADKRDIQFAWLAPGNRAMFKVYKRDILKFDRDLFVSYNFVDLFNSVKTGNKHPQVTYYNVGSMKTIYIGRDIKTHKFVFSGNIIDATNASQTRPAYAEELGEKADDKVYQTTFEALKNNITAENAKFVENQKRIIAARSGLTITPGETYTGTVKKQ